MQPNVPTGAPDDLCAAQRRRASALTRLLGCSLLESDQVSIEIQYRELSDSPGF